MSANYLAERLKSYGIVCERKTIYKDLEELSDFGFDIIRDRKGAYLATRQFELPELKLLVDAVQSSRFITERKSEELIFKLTNLLCKYDANSLKRQVIVKNRVKSMNESIYYNVDAVFEAMNKNCMISFRYGIWNAEKKLECKREGKLYRISPWYMQWENEKYYLIGYDEQERKIKHFRIDKLMQIQILSEKRQGKEDFGMLDMAAYGKRHFSMFQGKTASVTLLFDNDMAGVVLDRFGQDVWMHKEDEQHFLVVADVVVSSQFFGWLSGLGTKVHVLEPVWVREQYQNLLRSILDDI